MRKSPNEEQNECISNRLHVPESRSLPGTDETSSAAAHLIGYLTETARKTGISASKIEVERLPADDGVAGHVLTVPAPAKGFSDELRSAIELYGRTLTYWKKLLIDFKWGEDRVLITLHRQPEKEAEGEKQGFGDRLMPRTLKAARAMGKTLTNQAFMAREPAKVTMITLDKAFGGVAFIVKPPYSRVKDHAGIEAAYEKWVPLLADIYARDFKIKAETMKEGDFTTIFFTADKGYVSSMYDLKPQFRLVTPKSKKGRGPIFSSSTYRACKAIASQYGKHFTVAAKPVPAWGVLGYSIILRYKPGAGGKIADDSYMENVRMRAEKLMKQFHVQGVIRHQHETRSLVVTFFTGLEP